jgi:hypothetical protein
MKTTVPHSKIYHLAGLGVVNFRGTNIVTGR